MNIKNQIPHYSFQNIGIEETLAKVDLWSEIPLYNFEEIHSHHFIDILIFIKGGGKHLINFQEFEIKDFSIHVVSNNSTHKATRSNQSMGFSLLLNPLYIEQLQKFDNKTDYLSFTNYSKIIQLNELKFRELNYLFQEIIKCKTDHSYFLNLVASFLSKLISIAENIQNIEKSDELAIEYINFLNENFKRSNCIELFLQNLSISEVVFRRKIKLKTGKTPAQILQEKKIMEAQKLLYSSKLSIKEIAYELNFENESYFCKLFKKIIFVTPIEFRKKVQNRT